jgi:UDP-N-acetylglucosamine transferase subunit ALG13
MILVSVGTNEARFDRLLLAVASLSGPEAIFVQHGPSEVRPDGAECVAYLPFDALVEKVEQARVFITHAGVGSIMTAIAAGRHPIVVPRLRRYGEAVDDHQVPLARRMEQAGLVTVVDDPGRSLKAAVSASGGASAIAGVPTALEAELRSYLMARIPLGSNHSPPES